MKGKELQKQFGKRIRHYRKLGNMSQRELADRIDLSMNQIGCMERGIRFASPETLCRLSKALDIRVGELFNSYGGNLNEGIIGIITILMDAFYGIPVVYSKSAKKALYENAMRQSESYDDIKEIKGIRKNLTERYNKILK